MKSEFSDSWKNSKIVFEKQLELNLKQLQKNYPRHWNISIDFLKKIEFYSILDICCGVGSLYRLINDNFVGKYYAGLDYSDIALSLAKETWQYQEFYLKNIYDLDEEYTKKFDVIYASGIIDMIPDESLIDRLLKLNNKYAIFSRIHTIQDKSYYETYMAYDEIPTYKYYINRNVFENTIKENNYIIVEENDENYLLKRNK